MLKYWGKCVGELFIFWVQTVSFFTVFPYSIFQVSSLTRSIQKFSESLSTSFLVITNLFRRRFYPISTTLITIKKLNNTYIFNGGVGGLK